MKENHNGIGHTPNSQKETNTVNNDAIMNLATNLLKNENSIDMSSILTMATTLLNNDKLMNSVKDIAKSHTGNPLAVPKEPEKEEKTEFMLLHDRMEELSYDITKLKREINDVKEQNEYLKELLLALTEAANKKKWWRF